MTAEPEILSRKLVPEDKYLIVCSDGVFEFLTNEEVIDMVHSHTDPYLAACDLVELRCAAPLSLAPRRLTPAAHDVGRGSQGSRAQRGSPRGKPLRARASPSPQTLSVSGVGANDSLKRWG